MSSVNFISSLYAPNSPGFWTPVKPAVQPVKAAAMTPLSFSAPDYASMPSPVYAAPVQKGPDPGLPAGNILFSGDEAVKPPDTADSASRPGASFGCKTCQERKYVDGSDEANVSFKSPASIPAESSAAAVLSHEREHISNANTEARQSGGKVVSASIQLRSAICSECHRSYISGGTTTTVISKPVEGYSSKLAQDSGSVVDILS